MATITGDAGNNLLAGTNGADMITGFSGDDTLIGLGGSDELSGGDGNDWLTGGTGNDTLDGGVGIDTARYDAVTVDLTVNLAPYSGTVAYAGFPGNDDTLRSIENVWTGSGNDSIFTGNGGEIRAGAGDDTVVGSGHADTILGEAGNDSLSGDSGDDSLWGGADTDSIDGGPGTDLAIYSDETGAIRVRLATGTVDFVGSSAPSEHLVSIEGILAGSGNDTLFGTAGANDLRGGGGNDAIYGRAGDDLLDGGAGRDRLDGGAGNDTVSYASHGRGMTIDLAHQTAFARGTAAFTDVLVSIENATGGQGADHILGSARGEVLDGLNGNDTISGAGGADTITGGDGNDLMQGGSGADMLIAMRVPYPYSWYEDTEANIERFFAQLHDDGADTIDGGSGRDTLVVPAMEFSEWRASSPGVLDAEVNLAAGTLRLGVPNASTDRLASIENVTAGGGDDTVQGNAGANLISVGDGSNVVHAGAGDDTVIGGWWDDPDMGIYQDIIYGGAGNDFLVSNGAAENSGTWVPHWDLLDGSTGNDTLVAGTGGTTDMTGGTGADHFETSNAIYGFSEGEIYLPSGERPVIQDFDAAEGDVIVIRIAENLHGATPDFLGEVADFDGLGEFQWGYMRADGDTVIRFVSDHEDADPDEHPDSALVIRLVGYDGPLSESDFLFT